MNTIDRMKKLATGLFAFAAFAILLTSAAVPARAEVEDAAATYKAKCAMCHGPNGDKSFDPSKGDGALVDSVLKGIAPRMPKYDGKLTADQAQSLVTYMKSLRK
jgi:mono/diheme cytochrome c family protein